MPHTNPDDVRAAKELLESSEQLRGDLMTAVGKLDSYIEQLRAVVPDWGTDEPTPS